MKNDHTIVGRNHKTFFYEIDIISTKENHIYFTEVKYRKSTLHGSGLESITPTKLQRMHFAAESYLKYQNIEYKNYSPFLAAASVSGDLLHPESTTISWFPIG